MHKDSKRYYKDIKSVFPSRGQQEKRLIRDCKMRIIELGKLKPDITYDELQQHLGIPTDIVIQYYEGYIRKYIKVLSHMKKPLLNNSLPRVFQEYFMPLHKLPANIFYTVPLYNVTINIAHPLMPVLFLKFF